MDSFSHLCIDRFVGFSMAKWSYKRQGEETISEEERA